MHQVTPGGQYEGEQCTNISGSKYFKIVIESNWEKFTEKTSASSH